MSEVSETIGQRQQAYVVHVRNGNLLMGVDTPLLCADTVAELGCLELMGSQPAANERPHASGWPSTLNLFRLPVTSVPRFTWRWVERRDGQDMVEFCSADTGSTSVVPVGDRFMDMLRRYPGDQISMFLRPMACDNRQQEIELHAVDGTLCLPNGTELFCLEGLVRAGMVTARDTFRTKRFIMRFSRSAIVGCRAMRLSDPVDNRMLIRVSGKRGIAARINTGEPGLNQSFRHEAMAWMLRNDLVNVTLWVDFAPVLPAECRPRLQASIPAVWHGGGLNIEVPNNSTPHLFTHIPMQASCLGGLIDLRLIKNTPRRGQRFEMKFFDGPVEGAVRIETYFLPGFKLVQRETGKSYGVLYDMLVLSWPIPAGREVWLRLDPVNAKPDNQFTLVARRHNGEQGLYLHGENYEQPPLYPRSLFRDLGLMSSLPQRGDMLDVRLYNGIDPSATLCHWDQTSDGTLQIQNSEGSKDSLYVVRFRPPREQPIVPHFEGQVWMSVQKHKNDQTDS